MTGDCEADLVGYQPPLSLWGLVEQYVDHHERDEIKSMLGAGVVDETLELHGELQAFLDIWRDCRQDTLMKEESKSTRLPEPPGVRDRLVQEIKFFVENIREKAQEQGKDEKSFQSYNQHVISYAVRESSTFTPEPFSRPASVIGRDGKETPSLRQGSPASDRLSTSTCTHSTLSEGVEALAEKLNILKVDEVVQHLRSYLSEERELLVQDLRFLQECIEEENNLNATLQADVSEPSITELREERLKLEKEMLSDVFMHQKPLHAGFSSLKPASAKSKHGILPSNGPLKAVHVSAPDGIVLAGNVPESVIVKTQQKLNEHSLQSNTDAYIVKLGSNGTTASKEHSVIVPKPTSATGRPSSAMKFRSMIRSARSERGD